MVQFKQEEWCDLANQVSMAALGPKSKVWSIGGKFYVLTLNKLNMLKLL